MKRITITYLSILVLVISCKSTQNTSKVFRVIEEKITAETKFDYQIQETGEIFTNSSSKIAITYPQFDGWATPTPQAQLNELIRDYIKRSQKLFVAEGGQPASENGKTKIQKVLQDEVNYFRAINTEMTIDYKILTRTNQFMSLEINADYYMGGAHGLPTFKIINFDARQVKELVLKDLFQENADYLKIIAPYCRTQLTTRMDEISSDKQTIEDGTDPLRAENYQLFEVKKEGIEIVFAPYQVAPYVSGAQSVLVPYDSLKSIFREDVIIEMLRQETPSSQK